MTNRTGTETIITARAATVVVRRALREAGIDLTGVRVKSYGASSTERAYSNVFDVSLDEAADVLRKTPGVTDVTVYERGRFLSVGF